MATRHHRHLVSLFAQLHRLVVGKTRTTINKVGKVKEKGMDTKNLGSLRILV